MIFNTMTLQIEILQIVNQILSGDNVSDSENRGTVASMGPQTGD